MKIYVRPCWWPTDEAKKLGKIEEEMSETDYTYWFNVPGQLTYEFLRNKKKTDPYFAIKYLNDPTQMHVIKFPRELLVRKTIPALEVPGTGMIVMCVRHGIQYEVVGGLHRHYHRFDLWRSLLRHRHEARAIR
jgi:hypothetical protein